MSNENHIRELILREIDLINLQSRNLNNMILNYSNHITESQTHILSLINTLLNSNSENRNVYNTTQNTSSRTPTFRFGEINTIPEQTTTRNTYTNSFPTFGNSAQNYTENTDNLTRRRRRRTQSFTPSRLYVPTTMPLRSSIRRPIRRPLRRRNLNNTENVLTQILNHTFNAPIPPRPASVSDISNNSINYYWRDISNTTDQMICPIMRESFFPDDRVTRLSCGHVFGSTAIHTYLSEFDHRCPVCRFNIRQQSETNTTTDNYTISTQTDQPFTHMIDVSFNLGNTNTHTDISNNIFTQAVNELSNVMLSGISSALQNPDLSGNSITAEYSLFFPNNSTETGGFNFDF